MSNSKHISRICGAGAVLMVLLTVLYLCFGGTLFQAAAEEMPYVSRLFSTDRVHEIDIVAEESDWEEMLQNAMSEEYISCTAVIDGEKYANIGIRPKGNTSLSTVASSDSDRYSFKLEFDHYDKNSTYHGLDKLCLNNAIQDNTYMKDFLCYQMMNVLGADAPLSSFAWITVNGEDWGLYTAVEAVEDSFAQRVYGADHGQIYKPDSVSMGGGGRGAEARNRGTAQMEESAGEPTEGGTGEPGPQTGEGEENSPAADAAFADAAFAPAGFQGRAGNLGGRTGAPGGMGGSDDVLLVYSDDDPDSYPNIFDNAVFDNVTDEDKARLVSSLKALNQGDVESAVNVEEVLRYFAVHNFVLNEDSYTGSIIHNYYLSEENGLLSMIAWDYNLAFGGMGMGGSAGSAVNSPIDSPVSSGDISERPMAAWIFESEEYTSLYHQTMEELVSGFFESGAFETMIDTVTDMISPYVEKDPTAFCTYEEFQKGAETLREFCLLRAESVRGQLSGTIPSTSEGQSEDSSGFVDASQLTLSDMGAQGGGRDMERGANRQWTESSGQEESAGATLSAEEPQMAESAENGRPEAPQGEAPAGGMDGTPPEGTPPDGMPDGEPSQGMEDGFPGGDFPDMTEGASAPVAASSSPWETGVLLGGSAVLLLAGLLFAKFYR